MVPKLTNGYRIYTKNVQECFIVVTFSLIHIHSQRTDLVKEQELVYKWNLTFPSLKKLYIVNDEPVVNEPTELVANEAPQPQVMRRSEGNRRQRRERRTVN